MTVLSSASFLSSPLKISSATLEALTNSWESAVDMIAARIPQRNNPAMNGARISTVNTFLIISINTFSLLPFTSSGRYALPRVPINTANPRDNATQLMAVALDLVISFSSRTAINLTRMWGIPKYPSPQPRPEITLTILLLPSPFFIRFRKLALSAPLASRPADNVVPPVVRK